MTTEDESILSIITTEDQSTYLDETTTSPVSFRANCSVYNPCGRYGSCKNDLYGEWRCVCKFWWNGTLCNELSSSGTQVIALGVMLGVLILLFHGLALFRSMRQKRKLAKTDSKQNKSTINRTFPTIPTTALDPSRRILSLIAGILTLLLATSTLLVKWRIIKSIHDEIVDKFNRKQPLFFKRHSICRTFDITVAEFNLFTFPLACLLILLFILITKRVSFQRNKFCKGYIGLPIPLDFFAHVKRTLAAVIFAIFADELSEIATDLVGGGGGSSNRGVIVNYLVQILKVVIIGLRRYPIFAAVYIDNCFSLICATVYVWLDYSITIVSSSLCRNDFYQTEEDYNKTQDNETLSNLNYYGTGSILLFLQLLSDIPRYLCLAYISIKLPMLFIKRLRDRKLADRRLTREQKSLLYSSLPYSTESRYVKKLLGMNSTDVPTNRFAQIVRHIYAWRDDFRFSSRVICVYASIFLLLFFLTVEVCVKIPPKLNDVRTFLQGMADFISSQTNPPDPELQEEDPSSNFPLPHLIRPFFFGVFIALTIVSTQLLVMLANIRRNLLQAYRGDYCEIPRRQTSQNVSYITGNFHFGGYLIGYVILAYVILMFIATLLAVGIDAFITYGSVNALESIFKGIIPTILFILFKMYLNKILGRYVFLQHGGEVLSTNNRRAYMVFLYFNFFLDAFLGLIAAVIRLIKSIIGGMFYMCRLDYSPLGRKLETMDAGFNSYCGFIHLECAHRHPVLLCFVSHLLRDQLYGTNTKRFSKARHKWNLAVFLLNNPLLIYRRKRFLTHIQENDIKVMLIGGGGGGNAKEMYVEQPPILAHRASIISEKDLEDLWQRRRF